MDKPQPSLATRLGPEIRTWVRIVDAALILCLGLALTVAAIESARVS